MTGFYRGLLLCGTLWVRMSSTCARYTSIRRAFIRYSSVRHAFMRQTVAIDHAHEHRIVLEDIIAQHKEVDQAGLAGASVRHLIAYS